MTRVRFAGLKSTVARVLCHPAVGAVIGAVLRNRIRTGGVVAHVGAPVSSSMKAYLFFGLYESAERRFITRYLRTDLDVVELGSSIGVVSATIGRRTPPPPRLLCVEANPALIDLLRRNLSANGLASRAEVVHGAVAYETERGGVLFHQHSEHTHGSLSTGEHAGSVRVPAWSLSRLLADRSVGDYALVADIEGGEAAIIACDLSALARCRQIIIELHETTYQGKRWTVADLAAALVSTAGFTVRDSYGSVYVLER